MTIAFLTFLLVCILVYGFFVVRTVRRRKAELNVMLGETLEIFKETQRKENQMLKQQLGFLTEIIANEKVQQHPDLLEGFEKNKAELEALLIEREEELNG